MIKELGRGAMSNVYLAEDELIGRRVALKTFRLQGVEDPQEMAALKRRLVREARSAGRLSHPHVVTIYDIIDAEEEGGFYIAMEYVEGSSLAERLAWERSLGEAEILDIIASTASALDHFHDRGVVHRDIKPANILLTAMGSIKVSDFGIAWDNDPSNTQELTILGTPQYMSPEQVMGQKLDRRSDVFALGVLLYELCTREKAFPGKTIGEVTQAILKGDFVSPSLRAPDLSSAVSEVISKALSLEPDDRFQSAGALATALAEALGQPLPAVLAVHSVDPLAPTHALPAGSTPGSLAELSWRSRWAIQLRAGWRKLTVNVGWGPRILAGVALATSLVLLGIWLADRLSPSPPSPDSMTDFYERLVTTGRELMEDNPEEAAERFRMAELLVPGDPGRVRELREESERRAGHQASEDRLAEYRQAMDEGRYVDALDIVRALRAAGSADEASTVILGELEAALEERLRRESAEPARQASPRAVPPAETDPRAGELGRVGGSASSGTLEAQAPEGVLDLRLDSDSPVGTLILYADGALLYHEPFDFYDRKSWFRKVARSGTLTETLAIPTGPLALRLLVTREGEKAQSIELEGRFEAGEPRTLWVQLPAEGKIVVELD